MKKIKKPRLLVIAPDNDIRQSAVKVGKKENFVVRAVYNGTDEVSFCLMLTSSPLV